MAAKTSSAAKNRYNVKAYDRLAITVPKGRKADLTEHVTKTGQSINGLVNDLLCGELGMTEEEWGYKEAKRGKREE